MKTLVIAPLYKNAALVEGLVEAILAARADFDALPARMLFINDSPGDLSLQAVLDRELPRLAGKVDFTLWFNERNLGFVQTCNRGMAHALEAGEDVVLLNSDALLTPGCLREMSAVAYSDPMIGYVSPRSNNATICNSPYPDRFRHLDFPAALDAHRAIQAMLPRVTYTPTVVGFCMLIRHALLAEFGLFDPVYGGGYNEETDLVLRGNRRGYRSALANHAFAYHLGGQSFSLSEVPPYERERKNRRILLGRYPEYERAVDRYFTSAQCRAQHVLGALAPEEDGRHRILFHVPYLADFYNGTFEMTARTIAAFVQQFAQRYRCFIFGPAEAIAFHGLDRISGLEVLDAESREAPYLAAVRLSQPFAPEDLSLTPLAAITGYAMHDSIALDCLNLDENDLGALWERMVQTAGLLLYVSEFSAAQFNRRFQAPKAVVQVPALLSTEAAEYLPSVTAAGAADAILVVGNHYAHKHAVETAEAIHALDPAARVILLGVEVPARENLASYRAGDLDPDLIERIYAEARVVVFPSHYEGFGLPLMQALARKVPVVARRLPPFEEIAARTPLAANITLHVATTDLAAAALVPRIWSDKPTKTKAPVRRWADVAADLAKGIETARAGLDFATLRARMAAHVEGTDEPRQKARPHQPRLTREDLAEMAPLSVIRRAAGRRLNRLAWRAVDAARLVVLGDRARDARDFEVAADAYASALRKRPALDHIWVQYGHALKETGDRRGAEAAYRRAIELKPEVADSHLQLGHVLKIQNRLLEAKDAFQRALSIDPHLEHAAAEIGKLGELGAGHMRKAILMARDLVNTAEPGGVIGCVIARGDKVVGAGAGAGAPADAVDRALAESGRGAKGASAFLTLDPGAPAARRLVEAGVERVAIACRGRQDVTAVLRAAGVAVDRGFLELEARKALHYPDFASESVDS